MKSRVVFSSATNEWRTPEAIYKQLDAEFHFDFDPCPLGGDVDGLGTLFSEWAGKRVWVNPPYSDIAKWLARAREPDVAVFLIPARTDTKWFHAVVLPYASEIRFIRGRLRFGDATNSAPFPSMIVIFRRENA
jgi:site-specific DNA-methyltransferase (adenine-specific)